MEIGITILLTTGILSFLAGIWKRTRQANIRADLKGTIINSSKISQDIACVKSNDSLRNPT